MCAGEYYVRGGVLRARKIVTLAGFLIEIGCWCGRLINACRREGLPHEK